MNKKGLIHFSVGALFFALILIIIYLVIAHTNPATATEINNNLYNLSKAVEPIIPFK